VDRRSGTDENPPVFNRRFCLEIGATLGSKRDQPRFLLRSEKFIWARPLHLMKIMACARWRRIVEEEAGMLEFFQMRTI
jgi:hypothetical protein